MPEITEDQNIVEALRAKTEQEDIGQYLKSTWGGYTKASVREYLNVLRRQQQTTADTFSRNQQALFEEKEALKKSSETLKARLSQMEAEYRNLSGALRIHTLGEAEGTPSDITALKCTISAVEDELSKSGLEKSRLEKQLEQQKCIIEDYALKLEQLGQEKLSMQTMLRAEMQESNKQRNTLLRLTGELEEKNDEIKFLKALVSEGQLAALREKVADLTRQLEIQSEFLSGCNEEAIAQSEEITVLHAECETLRQAFAGATKNLEDLSSQNDKLIFANQSLSGQLEKEYKRSVALIQEKSYLTADKLLTVRKLEEANSKLILMELQIHKQISYDQTVDINESADRTEAVPSEVS